MALWNAIPQYKKNKKDWSDPYLKSARLSKAPCRRSEESAAIPDVSAARIQQRNIRRCIWRGKRIKRPKLSISPWLTRMRLNSGTKTIKNWRSRLEKSQISTKNCFDQNKPSSSLTAPSATTYWVITIFPIKSPIINNLPQPEQFSTDFTTFVLTYLCRWGDRNVIYHRLRTIFTKMLDSCTPIVLQVG